MEPAWTWKLCTASVSEPDPGQATAPVTENWRSGSLTLAVRKCQGVLTWLTCPD
jgi:hypothetical protein